MSLNSLPSTKKYLLESLSKHSDMDCNAEFLNYVGAVNEEKKAETTDDSNVLYGKSKGFKVPGTENDISPEVSSAAMYLAGKGLHKLADITDTMGLGGQAAAWTGAKLLKKIPGVDKLPIIGDAAKLIASGAVTPAPGLMGAALRNLAAQTGADWFEANIKNIGKAQNVLAAQGAGKPFVPLVVPDVEEPNTQEYSPETKKARAIESAKREETAKRYRALGYNIP